MKTAGFNESDFFLDISTTQLDQIIRQGKVRELKSGAVLFHQGDPATQSFVVLEGRLKLCILHELGKEIVVRYIGPGELAAMVAVLEGQNYPASAEAVGLTRVVGFERRTMLKIIADHPPVALNMIRNALNRLEEMQNRYLEIYAEQVEQRIARSLLRIMKQAGKRSGDEILIDFPITRQELADYTGTTLYTVSRTLSAWQKKGWVKSKRGRIIIANPHALVLFTENF